MAPRGRDLRQPEKEDPFPVFIGEKPDIWRDTPIRFLGYANELGESFRPILPKFVVPSYVIAFGYVFGDTFAKWSAATKQINNPSSPLFSLQNEFKNELVFRETADTLLWQTMASVLIPGFTINRVVRVVGTLTTRLSQKYPPVGRWLPTIVGLASIPFIVEPIDSLVHFILDHSIRPLSQQYLSEKYIPKKKSRVETEIEESL